MGRPDCACPLKQQSPAGGLQIRSKRLLTAARKNLLGCRTRFVPQEDKLRKDTTASKLTCLWS